MRTILQKTPSSKTLTLTQTPLPTPNLNDEHLIQVKACSPCSGELLWPANFPPPTPRPLIPCPDIAGTIISAPPNSPFQPGDSVYARTNYTRPGNAREYTIAVTDELARIPEGLSFVQAAAVPVSAETAWQILFEHTLAGVSKGEGEVDWETAKQFWGGKRVLVTAASGGVGMWVVQLARLLGAEVIGTCGGGNLEFVQSLGDQALDYRVVDLRKWAVSREVDVVVDCVGGRALGDAWWTVRDGGVVLSIYQPPLMVRPEGFERVVRDVFFVMEPVGRQLQEISKLIEGGKCHGMVDSVWPLEQFEEAFKRLDGGHAKGKIVFDLSLNQ